MEDHVKQRLKVYDTSLPAVHFSLRRDGRAGGELKTFVKPRRKFKIVHITHAYSIIRFSYSSSMSNLRVFLCFILKYNTSGWQRILWKVFVLSIIIFVQVFKMIMAGQEKNVKEKWNQSCMHAVYTEGEVIFIPWEKYVHVHYYKSLTTHKVFAVPINFQLIMSIMPGWIVFHLNHMLHAKDPPNKKASSCGGGSGTHQWLRLVLFVLSLWQDWISNI